MLLPLWAASAHAPPTPIPVPPLRVDGPRLVDSLGTPALLRGGVLPTLDAVPPALTFRILQQRWNLNAVRLPVSVGQWKREGQAYLDRVVSAVRLGNGESLVVILTAVEDGASLPGSTSVEFWRAAAGQLRSMPGVIFSLASEPSTRGIAGDRAAMWRAWDAAMQPLVDAIRSAGATQVIAAPAFQDGLDFQGFGREFYLKDANVIYEVHAFDDRDGTDEARDRGFGLLSNDVVVFAGDWGPATTAACNPSTTDAAFAAMAYFDRRKISWTVVTGKCEALDQAVLLWMTGDPNGFGSTDATLIANAAGGYPGPVAPGELLAIYGQLIGPVEAAGPRVTNGRVETSAGEVEVRFDGVAAPILLASYFQVNAQVPYEVAGKKSVKLQMFYRGVSSNVVELEVGAAAPGIFTTFVGGPDALALNEDGTVNGPSNPVARGSVMALFATGTGQTSPASVTGAVAVAPFGSATDVAVTVGGKPAEVLYAGAAPTLVGVTQVNVRVTEAGPVVLTAAGVASREVRIWVK